MTGWAVVLTRPAAEETAVEAIERAGYVVYLPRFRVTLRGVRIDAAGRRIRTRGPGAIVRRPLFPGYLFAGLADGQDEYALASAVGVSGVLHHRLADGTRGPAWLIPAAVIEKIRAEVESGRWDEVDMVPGDRVRISDDAGLWAGLAAELVSLDETGKAHLLLDILGRQGVPAVVPADLLSVVAP